MKAFLHELFDYNFYCNIKLIEECHRMDVVPERTIALFNHIVNAHHKPFYALQGTDFGRF